MQEESVAKAARELRKDKSRSMVKSAEWSESDGLLMFRGCKGNLTDLRRELHLSLAKGNPKLIYKSR
jgi:hypothetical protein